MTMSTDDVISLLKNNGYRITKQRKVIVDVIMNSKFNNSKDIYFNVRSVDDSIGLATVYRMINLLEDLNVIKKIDMISL
ncbi:MAG: transcriptional repressor [Lachnospiraceae bacterium]|nr:transcriptional repressor [Lachnospiraceae bacterium]MEE3461971.1 transcriptional repressor [Lachnospiraceae bacterium]